VVNVITTGGVYEQLAGNAGSFFIAAIISMTTTFLFPEDFDFEITRRMNAFQPEDADAEGHVAKDSDEASVGEKTPSGEKADTFALDPEKGDNVHVQNDASYEVLYKDFVLSVWLTIGIFVVCVQFSPI
jgi:hypothetical protein